MRVLLRSLLLGLMCLGIPDSARAQGVNLSWGDCGVNGTTAQTFACDANSGAPLALVGSFVPPSGMNEFLGLAAQIDICTTTPTFIDWWAHGTGRCRGPGALSTSFDFTSGPFSCVDFFAGQAAGGYAYDVSFGSADRARLRIQCAIQVDSRGLVDPSNEYYAFRVNINRTKSTGAGSCAGCSIPACITLTSIQLFQPLEAAHDPELSRPIDRNFVQWQVGVPNCPSGIPAVNSSWGKIKNLYR